MTGGTNPWRSDTDADVGITWSGVTAGSMIKIFTLNGHYLRTLTAESNGKAVWDRRNDSGDTAASGLYFYVINDPDGNQTRGKFAIIR